MKLTSRMKRIKALADGDGAVPLLHAFYKEGTGVCFEIRQLLDHHLSPGWWQAENPPVSKDYYKDAAFYRKRYNQVQLQEGHLMQAILDSGDLDGLLNTDLKNDLKRVSCMPRDLHCDLTTLPTEMAGPVHRVDRSEKEALLSWIRNQFGERWASQVEQAYENRQDPPVFIYQKEGHIHGFACYDVFDHRNGWFGPMGTSNDHREKGVGRALLIHALHKMKQAGYKEVIIGQAGPIEFYEKCCRAELIPLEQGIE
ncbi:GNAT family N-acetyltransferase [Halobacillus litoralis]|uniref:GNAT family N-acetyltransferase n=1 Tax=Halobacillus litoralis TaxID=45668 RepID=UPI001CD4B612|nr:GNAT family N-acetyltransferase [Halobacillus litoralis]MCA0969215.1 GNAT family N-acetyltransferase [Halobacillus litoralis]